MKQNYNKTDTQYIIEAYKNGMKLDDIVKTLTNNGRTTPNGHKYTTGTISYIVNNAGLHRINRSRAIKTKSKIAPLSNKYPDAHKLICDVLTCNLEKESQIYIVKLLSERL